MGKRTGRSRLIGKRVFLRAPELADWPEFSRLMRASARSMGGFASGIRSKAAFAAYVRRCQSDDYLGFLICRIEDEAVLGNVNLSQIVRHNFQNACIGYLIGAPFVRQGYMAEALQLVLGVAFKDLGLHRLEANIQPNNAASLALVKRAGFVMEGFSRAYLKVCGKWRDHERWAIVVGRQRSTLEA